MADDRKHAGTGDQADAAPLVLPAPVDLTPLDPARDIAWLNRRAASVAADVMAARRQSRALPGRRRSVLERIAGWSRPGIAAAAIVLVVAGSTLLLLPVRTIPAPDTLAESAGIPGTLVALASSHRPVSASELIDTFDVMAVSGHSR